MISELRDQCPRYSGIFIYRLLALASVENDFPEIRHFLDNSGCSSNITPKIKSIKISESGDQCQRYSETFICTLLALARV